MNWYKKSQKVSRSQKNIPQIAQQVRKNFIGCDNEDCLKDKCLPVSRKLKQALINNGYDATITRGNFTVDKPSNFEFDPEDWKIRDFDSEEAMQQAKEDASINLFHYWVEVGNIIIDLTASQFNDLLDDPVPKIQIGTYEELERYTPIVKDWI